MSLMMRRGKATAECGVRQCRQRCWIGDFIYTRAFQMMTSWAHLKILEVMSPLPRLIEFIHTATLLHDDVVA